MILRWLIADVPTELARYEAKTLWVRFWLNAWLAWLAVGALAGVVVFLGALLALLAAIVHLLGQMIAFGWRHS